MRQTRAITAYLFVHSPLLGPAFWDAIAALAGAGGDPVAVPDLTGVAEVTAGRSGWFVEQAVRQCPPSPHLVVVGHSGAGAFLPAIAGRRPGATTVFLDAVVPPVSGAHRTSSEFAEFLDQIVEGDRLPRWCDWWPGEWTRLVPDRRLRRRLAAEMPRLPRAFYDEEVAVPEGWSGGRNGYVLLSPAYAEEHREAARRGWATHRLGGSHLSPVSEPGAAWQAITEVVADLTEG